MNLLDTYLDWQHRTTDAESSMKTPDRDPESSMKTPAPEPEPEPQPKPGIRARRVDLLLDLLEHAAYEQHDHIDAERAAIGVTVDYDALIANQPDDAGAGATLSSGAAITGEAARRLACDAGIHRLVTRGRSEILDVGRKTRHWSVAQRRAIKARFGHQCAFPDCGRRVFQIHHIHWWENGGETNIDRGIPACIHHHHLVHEGGWTVSYNPASGVTTFTGPLGQTAVSHPSARFPTAAAA